MIPTAAALRAERCEHRTTALDAADIARYLALLDSWRLEEAKLVKTFAFKNYYETLAFVNAIAYLMHTEDHHPELTVTYNRCTARFDTHSVNAGRGGLSLNDFICAAKVDALFQPSSLST